MSCGLYMRSYGSYNVRSSGTKQFNDCVPFNILFLLSSDRNECKSTTGHVCQQLCVNEPGDYSCACYRGYTLDANNYTCSGGDSSLNGTQ